MIIIICSSIVPWFILKVYKSISFELKKQQHMIYLILYTAVNILSEWERCLD